MGIELPTLNPLKTPPELKADWERTTLASERVKESEYYEPPDEESPYGYFAGRPIIGSGSERIIGGVYPGARTREAIVVDDRKGDGGDKELAIIYEKEFLPELLKTARKRKVQPRGIAIHFIIDFVTRKMPYDGDRTKKIIGVLTKGIPDQKIHLASFITNKAGVCRHQALFAGYLLEKLKNETDPKVTLRGKTSIERNSVTDENSSGAHAWTRYTTKSGDVWIIDPAQERVGKLQDLMKDPTAWEYARPEDIKKYTSSSALSK